MVKYIKVNSELCNGCRICAMACSLKKSRKFNQFNTGIWIDSDDENGINTPHICRQCRNPVCVKACPAEKAWKGKTRFEPPIFRDKTTGTIRLDSQKDTCIGCRECVLACPFGAIRVVPEDLQLAKCDLCGGDPECVKFCPTGAVEFIEVTKIPSKLISKSGIGLKEQAPVMDPYAQSNP